MLLLRSLKKYPQLLILALLLAFAQSVPVLALGDAYFTLSPSSGSHAVGSTFTVTVYEYSSAADNTDGVQANLSYNSSLLQWESNTLGAFNTICGTNSGGGGSVNIACASSSPQSGTQTVATITFKALASGTASVSMVTGPGGTPTDIQNSSGSVWDGALKSASFSITAASTGTTSAPKSSTSTKTSTPTPTPSPAPTSKPTTTTPTTTTQAGNSTTQAANAAVTIIVMDTNGQPIANAKVVLDSSMTMYTNSQGKANFPAESAGSHDVTVTAPGKKPYQTKVTLTANQSIPLELQLTSSSSNGALYAGIGVLGILILLGVGLYFLRSKLPFLHKDQFVGATAATQSPVVGYNSSQPTPAPQPVPVRPTTPSNGPQQKSSFGTDSIDGMRRRF